MSSTERSYPGTEQLQTVAAYDAFAADYRDGTASHADSVAAAIAAFVADLPAGARVLEIGSGPGFDALQLEAAGLSVRRTDITPAFVQLLRETGHEADQLDPLVDDLTDPERPGTPYDGVWADACLLHVLRTDLPAVLTRLAEATGPGGRLYASLKEGDGEGWSEHGHVSAPRHFTYWRSAELAAVVEESGWTVDAITRESGHPGTTWLALRATRWEGGR